MCPPARHENMELLLLAAESSPLNPSSEKCPVCPARLENMALLLLAAESCPPNPNSEKCPVCPPARHENMAHCWMLKAAPLILVPKNAQCVLLPAMKTWHYCCWLLKAGAPLIE